MLEMPGPHAMRHVAVVLTVYRDCSEEEEEHLVELVSRVSSGSGGPLRTGRVWGGPFEPRT